MSFTGSGAVAGRGRHSRTHTRRTDTDKAVAAAGPCLEFHGGRGGGGVLGIRGRAVLLRAGRGR